ncbi:hypothetical protein ATY77_03540 [Rhizobium sp. R634]|nr:hypothetical protein ATY77_03540 [Rhizobium sp. R634]
MPTCRDLSRPHPETPHRASKDEVGHSQQREQEARLERVLRGFGLWSTRLRMREVGGCRTNIAGAGGRRDLSLRRPAGASKGEVGHGQQRGKKQGWSASFEASTFGLRASG